MSEKTLEELKQQLGLTNTSLLFLALTVGSILLSWQATVIQRDGLCRILNGTATQEPDVYHLRLPASALALGCVVYFFLLALDSWQQVQDQQKYIQDSAWRDLWAAALVLAAALVRQYDLHQLQRQSLPPTDTVIEEAL